MTFWHPPSMILGLQYHFIEVNRPHAAIELQHVYRASRGGISSDRKPLKETDGRVLSGIGREDLSFKVREV